jgi:hypothetical protein
MREGERVREREEMGEKKGGNFDSDAAMRQWLLTGYSATRWRSEWSISGPGLRGRCMSLWG